MLPDKNVFGQNAVGQIAIGQNAVGQNEVEQKQSNKISRTKCCCTTFPTPLSM
jgi:hypothetical protein